MKYRGMFMGKVHGKLHGQKKTVRGSKPINHENIDVNRHETLKQLEDLKKDHRTTSNSSSNLAEVDIITVESTGRSHPTTSSIPTRVQTRNRSNSPHSSNHSPSTFNSASSPNSGSFRKYIKDGKIMTEQVFCIDNTDIPSASRMNNSHIDSNEISTSTSMSNSQISPSNISSAGSMVNTQIDSSKVSNSQFMSNNMSRVQPLEKLTTDDDESHYDAYINCPEEHINVAKRLLEILEKPPHNFKLFLPDRQILPGLAELDAKTEIVENRCSGKVIALISKDYDSSKAIHFINHFAKALDPVSKGNKLIPVMIEKGAQPPRILQGMYMINYDRDIERDFFWDKLSKSIRMYHVQHPSNS